MDRVGLSLMTSLWSSPRKSGHFNTVDLVRCQFGCLLRGSSRPANVQHDRTLVRTEAKVESQLVLVAFTGPRFHVSSKDPLAQCESHDRSHGTPVHQRATAIQPQLDPGMVVPFVNEKLAIGDQVEVAIVVEISPGGLVGGPQVSNALCRRHVYKFPVTLISIEHGVVLDPAAAGAIDGGEVQVEVAVVVKVTECRGGEGLLARPAPAERSLNL